MSATPSAGPSSLRTVVWPLLKPYRWHLALAIGLNALHGISTALQALAPKWLIDDVLTAPGLATEERWQRLALLGGAYLLATIFGRMLVWHLGYRVFTWVREQTIFALRAQFFRHVNHLCLRFHGNHASGEIFSYLFGSPLATVMQFYHQASMWVPGAIVIIATTLITAFSWDLPLALVLVATVGVSAVMMERSHRTVRAISKDFQRVEGAVSGTVNDLLRGNRAVKLYAMEESVAVSFEAQAQQIGRKSYERDVRNHIEWMKQETVGYVAFVVLMATACWRYQIGAVTVGEVTAVLIAFGSIQGPIQQIFGSITQWGAAQASIDRIGEVLAAASTTPDPAPSAPLVAVPPAGDLRLANVHFSYAGAADAGGPVPVLTGIDLHIPYGQRIAFVGPSGSGKSTLSQLLLRLYDPDQGTVSLAGVDLRGLQGTAIRKRFGVVPQDPFIFRTTVRDNVKVARPDADDGAIRLALEQANAWEFVARMPQGLDTPVGEGGSSLSGGQRQRLAIARALLADPPFFLFDEATSALDTLSEELIQRSLATQLRGRTAIFIAHRLATVKDCDRIIVIAGGKVAQDGTYDQLLAQPGLFAELVHGQQLRA